MLPRIPFRRILSLLHAFLVSVVIADGSAFGQLDEPQLGTDFSDFEDENAADLSELSPRQARIWKQHWQTFARRYIIHDDRFVHFRGYESKYPSSRHITADEAYDVLNAKWGSGLGRDLRRELAAIESQAVAMPIPEMAVGQYGYIHSATIHRIYGDEFMRVRDVWLIDSDGVRERERRADARLSRVVGKGPANQQVNALHDAQNKLRKQQRSDIYYDGLLLVGFNTLANAEGQRYKGPSGKGVQIAVIGSGLAPRDEVDEDDKEMDEKEKKRRERERGRKFLIAIPAERLENGLTEGEFIALLRYCQIKPSTFSDQMIEQLIKNRAGYEESMFEFIESNRANVNAKLKAEAEKARAEAEVAEKAKKEQESKQKADGQDEAPAKGDKADDVPAGEIKDGNQDQATESVKPAIDQE